jgi:hypothetical protein
VGEKKRKTPKEVGGTYPSQKEDYGGAYEAAKETKYSVSLKVSTSRTIFNVESEYIPSKWESTNKKRIIL